MVKKYLNNYLNSDSDTDDSNSELSTNDESIDHEIIDDSDKTEENSEISDEDLAKQQDDEEDTDLDEYSSALEENDVNEIQQEEYSENTKLNDKWILWYHHEKNNWKISGYRKIYKIETIKDFWELYNNFDRIGGINNQHFFLMREGIEPVWEDEKNKKGGCWSFKKMDNESAKLWEDLSVRIIGEKLLENNSDLNGLSICLKRQLNSVIKIWNNNSKNNQINLLNKEILDRYGKDILYIAHIPEF